MPRIQPLQVAVLRNRGMALLLLSLVITIFIVPVLLPYGSSGRYLIDAMMTVNMLVGVLAISDHRKIAAALIVLSLLAIAARWADLSIAPSISPAMRELPTIVVLLVLGVAVGINVFGPARAVVDRILGAVVLYLLLGLEWAVGYGIIDAYLPGAFTGSGRGIQHWVYFSFVTLTTLGYGDIVPSHERRDPQQSSKHWSGSFIPQSFSRASYRCVGANLRVRTSARRDDDRRSANASSRGNP